MCPTKIIYLNDLHDEATKEEATLAIEVVTAEDGEVIRETWIDLRIEVHEEPTPIRVKDLGPIVTDRKKKLDE